MAGQNEEASDRRLVVGRECRGFLPSVSPAGISQLNPEELRLRISQMQDS